MSELIHENEKFHFKHCQIVEMQISLHQKKRSVFQKNRGELREVRSSFLTGATLRMLGGVAGRHMSTRRRGSSPMVRLAGSEQLESMLQANMQPSGQYRRRRRAVTTSDHKSCALIQTRIKLGDIM
ncbi:hypothetical protein RUM43_011025 [Polyplax serrata]|uniref:Uncharacterized protein n=1 Tax=Polyplax serrata TaxID=468196 RepID=A0AAN8RZP2_POLSC